MKTLLHLASGLFALLAGGCVAAEPTTTYYAQQPVPVTTAPPAPVEPQPEGPPPRPPGASDTTVVTGSAVTESVQPLDQLVAPIALYPDVLVALILPASTMSSDVVLAARYLSAGGDPQQVDSQPWDDSVKGLAHYPDLVKWMDENLAWTQQLGAAYLESADNVMAAVQRVRAEARAKGLLADTPQQQVVVENDTIEIVPAQPDVIYVPRYDPEIIFVDRPVIYETDPWLTFGVGFGIGWWLSYDCDWHHRRIWIDRHARDNWRDHHHTWRQPNFVGGGGAARPPGWEPWHPAPGRPRPAHRDFDRDHRPAQPRPMPGAPHRDHDGNRWQGRDDRRHDGDGRPARGTDSNVHGPRPSGDGHRAQPDRPANNTPNPQPQVQPPRADRVAPPANRPGNNQPRRDREPGQRRPNRPNDAPSAPRVEPPDPTPQPQPQQTATPATTPRDRPRLGQSPLERREPRADRAALPARPSRPEPQGERVRAPVPTSTPAPATMPAARDERRAPVTPPPQRAERAPAQPREPRADRVPRTDPAPRTEPAPRVAPTPQPQSQPRVSPSPDTANRSRGEDRSRNDDRSRGDDRKRSNEPEK